MKERKRLTKEQKKLEARKYRLMHCYGLTLEDYDKMLKDQDYRCAICRRSQSLFKYNLHVDHNHSTGKVRGLLCAGCNPRIEWLIRHPLYIRMLVYIEKTGSSPINLKIL